jgi:Fe-S-cluster-containing dehydrogenase component/DMSO reductase anchor subunit
MSMSTNTSPTVDATKRWGMIVDLNRCVGCQTCTIACKHANDTPPEVQWRRVLDVELGSFPDVQRLFMVTGCQHCEEPPCVPVCPTGATAQRADGLVTMDYDLCIGCSYCAVSCPYQARTIVHEMKGYFGKEMTKQEKATAHPERVSVMSKCTFCVGRIDEAAATGQTPGVDLSVTPACSASCIAQALHFGDFNNPESNVSKLAAEKNTFQMHEELGTNPQIRYAYDLPKSTPGREARADETGDDVYADPVHALTGRRQTFWDWKGATNFILGGMGSGLIVIAWVGLLLGQINMNFLPFVNAAGAAFMGLGLLTLLFKIGRPFRILNALRRPQSSWMSREIYLAAIFFPAVALDFLPWLFSVSVLGPQAQGILHGIIGLCGAGFLFAQARILFAAKGIPAWRAPLIPWMIIATGLFEGVGILAIAQAVFPGAFADPAYLLSVGSFLAAINFILWQTYRIKAKDFGIGPLAQKEFKSASLLLVLVGQLTPWVLLTGMQILPELNSQVTFAVIGLGTLFGGWLWKKTVLLNASYQQGFALPRVPQRGSGDRAAPVRMGIS